MNRDVVGVGVAVSLWIGFVLLWFAGVADLTSGAVAAAVVMTVLVVATHYADGTSWEPTEDISQTVLERRAESVPETSFPEPANRSVGGGGASVVTSGEAEAELAESETSDEEGFDPEAIPEEEVEVHEIEFAKQGETVEVATNETILDAAEDEGWDLPYACREGQCLSCAGHAVDGPAQEHIRHANNEMLNNDEMDDGYMLTCTACPVDSFTLETGESP
jgi:2Fe-2S type ferredoxin